MGASGYSILLKLEDAVKTSGTNWLATSFSLPVTSPPGIARFFHVSFSFKAGNPATPQKILMTKNEGEPTESFTPLNNNADVDGWFYRSDVISSGDKLNFKVVGTTVTLTNFLLMLED